MRCVNCGAFSLRTICAACAANLAECRLSMRQVEDFSVFYYYGYSEIRELILSKHHEYGAAVLARIASLSLAKFPLHLQREISANPQNYEAFKTTDGIFKFNAVPLDDDARSGYSHTAILARALKSELVGPKFHCLRAQNRVKYSGQSLEFRLKHKRNFKILTPPQFPVILVDDIITSGLSMLQARESLIDGGFMPVCGLVLANAKE
ncbi:MAG: ComF family protein [Campylobacter gracilis]|uniref:ComF family protein n=1 Tax=Campylobacter gracilis TaxID=824 RepID=UPI0026EA5953|nr:ComF family protein [Campylobacter gracilis]MBS6153481.1 ComF family protein [Campylobacter gracilis]